MRRLLLLLLIYLMPLRLWAGDAMAMQITESAPSHSKAMSAATHCHEMGDEGATAPDDADMQVGDRHGACSDCGVCHGPMAGPTSPTWTGKTPSAAAPADVRDTFASAIAPPRLKPPRA